MAMNAPTVCTSKLGLEEGGGGEPVLSWEMPIAATSYLLAKVLEEQGKTTLIEISQFCDFYKF